MVSLGMRSFGFGFGELALLRTTKNAEYICKMQQLRRRCCVERDNSRARVVGTHNNFSILLKKRVAEVRVSIEIGIDRGCGHWEAMPKVFRGEQETRLSNRHGRSERDFKAILE